MRRTQRSGSLRGIVAAGVLCVVAGPAPAEESTAGDASADAAEREAGLVVPGRSTGAAPPGSGPGLDALLQLPSDFTTSRPRAVAGASEAEWRRRFSRADEELAQARAALESTKRELDGVADGGGNSQWSIAPPVGGGESSPATSPLSFKLRQQLREEREKIEVLEKAYRELRIEADLAGVPQAWRTSAIEGAEAARN